MTTYPVRTMVKEFEKENIVDPQLEYIDPTPNIYALFMSFNKRFFWGKLDMVEISWSKRMTTCAGICTYRGRRGGCSIRLSSPLLSLRPRKDLVETLLHEMIHAYLFVTHNNKDRDGHGPEFHKHMYRINKETGTQITVYHTFHDEVKFLQPHVWRCSGSCKQRSPFYGILRRATNRKPGPSDAWWADHQRQCGGTYIKISEPSKPSKAAKNDKATPITGIRKYFNPQNTSTPNTSPVNIIKRPATAPSNSKRLKTDSTSVANKVRDVWSQKTFVKPHVKCPVCDAALPESQINQHVDECLAEDDEPVIVEERVKCPVCNKKMKADGVKEHLESCLSCSFENLNPEDDFDDPTEDTAAPELAACPCCAELFPEDSINRHIDECLTTIALNNGLVDEF